MATKKTRKDALVAIGVMLSAMLLVPESAQAQVSVSANVTASVTVLAPVQPEILRNALFEAARLPATVSGTHTYALDDHGAQVSVSTEVPPSRPDPAAAVRRVTISFPGT